MLSTSYYALQTIAASVTCSAAEGFCPGTPASAEDLGVDREIYVYILRNVNKIMKRKEIKNKKIKQKIETLSVTGSLIYSTNNTVPNFIILRFIFSLPDLVKVPHATGVFWQKGA